MQKYMELTEKACFSKEHKGNSLLELIAQKVFTPICPQWEESDLESAWLFPY